MISDRSHGVEAGVLPYRNALNADSEAFGHIAQPTPRLPIPTSSQLPLHSPSWYIPSETGSALAGSTAGSNLEHPAYRSKVFEYAPRDRGNHCYSWRFSSPPYGCDAHVLRHPLGHPLSPAQFVKAQDCASDEPFPRFMGYGKIFTDDARMKLGDGIRRQCYNCRATETTTWRRSTLSQGKLLCNKCGLFERTHAVPRPKSFPRRRRSRPSVRPSMDPPAFGNEGHYHFNDPLPNIPSSSYFPDAFSTGGGATTPRDMQWMTYDIPHTSSPSSHISPCHVTAEQQSTYHATFQSPTTTPTLASCTHSPPWELLSHAN